MYIRECKHRWYQIYKADYCLKHFKLVIAILDNSPAGVITRIISEAAAPLAGLSAATFAYSAAALMPVWLPAALGIKSLHGPRKTIQNTPFQQHTIYSNTEMLWGGFLFFIFFLQYIFFSIEKFVILRVKYYPLLLHLQKCDTPKFEFVAETGGC